MLRPNPVTGELEDDGLSPPPLTAPIFQATPESTGGGAPAPVPAAAPIQIVAPPEETHRVERSGPQTTFVKPSAEATKDLGAIRTAHADEAAADDQIVTSKFEEAGQQANLAQQQAALAQQRAAQEEAARKAHQLAVEKLTAEKEKRRAEEERLSHPTTYWEDKGVPARILGGLLMLVGGGASGLAGRPNGVIEIYRQAEADDRQRKIEAFKNAKEFRVLAEKDIGAAKVALADKLEQITKDEITKSNLLVKNAEALAKRTGLPHVLAEAEKLKAARDAENAEKRLKLQQHYDVQVQSGRQTTSDTVNVNRGGVGPDLTVKDLSGKVVGRGRSDIEAKKLREMEAAGLGVINSLTALKTNVLAEGRLGNVPGTDAKATREAMISDATSYLTTLFNTGVLNSGEYERYKSQLNTGLRGGEATAKGLDVMIGGLRNRYDSHVKAQAVPVDTSAPAPAAPAKAEKPAAKGRETKVLSNGKRAYRVNGGEWRVLD